MVFKVSVFEFDQCFSPNSIWADEEDSVDTSMSSREGKRSKSLGQSIGTSLCSLKDGRVEVELAKVDVQILVDDVGVSGVDFNRSNGIESSAAGFSKDIFNAFIDSCNADACNQMQDVSFIAQKQQMMAQLLWMMGRSKACLIMVIHLFIPKDTYRMMGAI
ncbi:hypothetical protein V6N13_110530 [Hibiscus sabdariffa]